MACSATIPKPFDPAKPVQTRDGRRTRIISTNRVGGSMSIVALIDDMAGYGEAVACFTAGGLGYGSKGNMPGDLVNIPTKRVGWLNLYRHPVKEREPRPPMTAGPGIRLYESRDQAITAGYARPPSEGYFATIKVEWED